MNDLVAKLRAALDEDERVALSTHDVAEPWSVEPFQPTESGGLPGSTWVVNGPDGDNGIAVVQGSYRADHIARHDPARVLRQVAAMRKVLELHYRGGQGECGGCNWTAQQDYETPDVNQCPTLLTLAEAYGIEVL